MIKMTCWHLFAHKGFLSAWVKIYFMVKKIKKLVAAKTAIIDSLLANTRGINE